MVLRTTARTSAASSVARHQAVDAERLGLFGPPAHHLDDAETVPRLEEVGVVVGRQNGDREQLEACSFRPATAARIVCG